MSTKPDAPVAKPSMKISLIELLQAFGLGKGDAPKRSFTLPELPPRVIPRGQRWGMAMDSACGPNLAWLNQNATYCGMGFPGYAYLSELSQRSEYRAPAETIANEMTRKWIKLKGTGEGDSAERITDLTKSMVEFGVQEHFRRIAEGDGLFGRMQLAILIKGQENRPWLPLTIDDKGRGGVAKGSLQGFRTVEPIWTTPSVYNSNDPTAPDFYKPDAWYVLGKKYHATRLLTFISRELPDIMKPSYNFGGLSMTQLMEPYVRQFLRTRDAVSDLIHNFSIIVLKTNMESALQGGDGGELLKRARLFTQQRDNQGVFLVDKEDEELEQVAVPLSGLAELQAQAQEHMAAPSHIPLVKLLGITPSGLNASSEGEITVFYDFVRSMQESLFSQHLTTVLKVLQLNLWGKVDDSITFEYVSLDEPTGTELAAIRKSDAEMDATYINSGVIDPAEVREKVSRDPASGYNNLKGPPPDPPELVEHALGEESADNAHARGQEAAEAQAERDKAAAKDKPPK